VTSPWTGATIRVQSLLHACAVWYAIYSYWQRGIAARAADDADAQVRCAVSLRGFQERPAALLVKEHSTLLSSDATELLERLDEAMVDLTQV
jgi:hypothetical protein